VETVAKNRLFVYFVFAAISTDCIPLLAGELRPRTNGRKRNIFGRIAANSFFIQRTPPSRLWQNTGCDSCLLFTNKVKQKSEVSFRSAKVNPYGN